MVNPMSIVSKCLGRGMSIVRDNRSKNMAISDWTQDAKGNWLKKGVPQNKSMQRLSVYIPSEDESLVRSRNFNNSSVETNIIDYSAREQYPNTVIKGIYSQKLVNKNPNGKTFEIIAETKPREVRRDIGKERFIRNL